MTSTANAWSWSTTRSSTQYGRPTTSRRPAGGTAQGDGWGRGQIPDPAPQPAGYDRLAQVKRRYDPASLFDLNQNITPA
jgi:FAD/FMN-containing dehydrogenase